MLQHDADPRPAWLWSQDGQKLIWHNGAAALFLAKLKKHGLKLAPLAIPIKGQVARNIRLGSTGRSSLARIQFLAGEKPTSSTCATTPLIWQDEQPALLIVGVDPIDPDLLAAADEQQRDEQTPEFAPVAAAPDQIAAIIEADDHAYQRELESWRSAEQEQAFEPAEPATADAVVEPEPVAPQLFRVTGQNFVRDAEEQTDAEADLSDLERLDEAFIPEESVPEELNQPEAPAVDAEMEAVRAALADIEPERRAPDIEAVERVSRYNFDELSRILNDRVGETAPVASTPMPIHPPATTGALVNLGGETLVLNRLPLGILVFRDQQILFANRAITEMVGYDSVAHLREAGLAAMFPAAGPEGQQAGPVNHLVQRDGTLVPVTARLQSMSWQGRPALMLSASATEVRTGHEAAVRAFAESFADTRGDGFFETNRAGVISAINGKAATLLGADIAGLTGKTLSTIIAPKDGPALREFLERPARFAETARPCVTLRGAGTGAEVQVFAQGQAGTVTGYFGFVHPRERLASVQIGGPNEVDPALLARISRGVRRPLNTIIGFSDMIRSEAFGALGNERYEGYAEDIAKAGHEITALVDELDDFTRLREGRYLPQRASIDLTSLLESCVVRIRHQASSARVIVRNGISENLPKVTADRASLAQAVLNLLASAIDQTPSGGAVVISAQRVDDGGIAIHVRDSSTNAVDLAERFVVFRDGTGRDGQMLAPVRSSVGLALTRSLLAVNAFSLSVDPAGAQGLLFSLLIPADLVEPTPV